jgi:hypothetical protein
LPKWRNAGSRQTPAAPQSREIKGIAAPLSSCVRCGHDFTVLHAAITSRRLDGGSNTLAALLPLVAIRFPSHNSKNRKESTNVCKFLPLLTDLDACLTESSIPFYSRSYTCWDSPVFPVSPIRFPEITVFLWRRAEIKYLILEWVLVTSSFPVPYTKTILPLKKDQYTEIQRFRWNVYFVKLNGSMRWYEWVV